VSIFAKCSSLCAIGPGNSIFWGEGDSTAGYTFTPGIDNQYKESNFFSSRFQIRSNRSKVTCPRSQVSWLLNPRCSDHESDIRPRWFLFHETNGFTVVWISLFRHFYQILLLRSAKII
jgi:hypothetical protein